jgi:hypothetical protein
MANGPSLFVDVGEMVSPIVEQTPEMSDEMNVGVEVVAARQESDEE